MATSSVHPSGIWASTSMSFSCAGTSPSHWENKAFTCGCAFEHYNSGSAIAIISITQMEEHSILAV
jgi:hypothetical protein